MSKDKYFYQLFFIQSLYFISNFFLEVLRKLFWPCVKPDRAKRVCIYRIGTIGDIVCALPAMYAIRQAYPSAHLTLLTTPVKRELPGAYELLANAEWLDEIIVYYADDIDTWGKRWALLKRLKKKSFNLWIELPGDLSTIKKTIRNMIFARLTGVRWAYGWRINTIRNFVQIQSKYIHHPYEVQRLTKILSESGIKGDRIHYPLPITCQHRETVTNLLSIFPDPKLPIIALAPGAKRTVNRWQAERFASVVKHLKKIGNNVILIGGSGDISVCALINDLSGNSCLNLAGQTTLLESAGVIEKCRMLIANDSGVQHLAVAVHTPCISLFSARDIKGKWEPDGNIHTVIRKWPDCHSCLLESCPKGNLCIKMISTDEIIGVIDEKLQTINKY